MGDDGVTLLGQLGPDEWGAWSGAASSPKVSLAGTVDAALDSVVTIEVDGRRSGAGFHVALPGIVVTAASVIDDAVTVEIVLRDGSRRPGRVLGTSPAVDVAAVEIDASDISPMHSNHGLEQARPGDFVLAVADRSAAAASRWSTLAGATGSAPLRESTIEYTGVGPVTVGGPLINTAGDVLGVVTPTCSDAGTNGTAVGTAIPVDVARAEVMRIVGEP